jgi:hypothetical protein
MFCRCLQCWRYCSANKAVGDCPCYPGTCSGDFLAALSRHRCGIVGFFRVGGFSSNVGWLPRRISMTPDCSYKTASLQSPNVSISTALFRPNVGLRTVGRRPAWHRVGRQAPVIAVDLQATLHPSTLYSSKGTSLTRGIIQEDGEQKLKPLSDADLVLSRHWSRNGSDGCAVARVNRLAYAYNAKAW